MPVSYWINDGGRAGSANGSEFYAVQSSFQTWQDIQSANIRFDYKGVSPARSVGYDGVNLITFADDSTPLGSSTIAATFTFFTNQSGNLFFDEADIAFNTSLAFSTSGEEGRYDIQSVLTHEIGHFLGLDHSALLSSVMVPFGVPAQLDQRTLSYDDIAGVTEIYPNPSSTAPTGQIQGVIRDGTSGVFGAHVVAVSQDGTPLVATLSRSDGSYRIPFLPPGDYRVYAEPLDLPVGVENIGGGTNGWYGTARTDFGTTYFGNVSTLSDAAVVRVTAGTVATADIQTLPVSATGLNATRPFLAARIERGSDITLQIGGQDITPGISITTSNPELVLGLPTFGGRISSTATTSATVELFVSPSAPFGPKNIAINRGGAASVVSGGLVIVEAGPSNIAVAPTSGPVEGGTPVTIRGADFRPGAQVTFAGLPALDMRIIDSGTILAMAPVNAPGKANIVIVNADGTWGVARQAFTYLAQPPVITAVSPLNGPPSTVVNIEGDHFDTHIQNVEVRFNGLPARVVNTTTTTISAIVPFGATSGPVSVVVFGQATDGPVFTVTSPVPSTNTAGSVYEFVDASPANGGTQLSFNNPDDAVTFVSLPFNFTLFRDTYLEGSTISVSTNGWLSLEAISVAEFQNASLPAQAVTRSDGSLGTVAASLIAPFWDDLYFRSVTNIAIRTVGAAPNRQLVVQWSGATILDEMGNDLNANVTFEAVLFEGSNDIQFVYKNMTGPRSDGSSATIGAQNLKRTTAVQSGFNQGIVQSGSFITYHFQNGVYSLENADNTPPSRPVVTVGVITGSMTELWASWTSDDPESGIREFQYAIGRTPGGTDVRPFTSTTQNSVFLTGLSLKAGATYYFAVEALNNAGLTSDVGVSDGTRVDPTFHPDVTVVPWVLQGNSEFSGLELLTPGTMTVVLKAIDPNGALVLGAGIRNPAAVHLNAGQQYARVISEIFGIEDFDGWIEVEAPDPGLTVYSATGGWDLTRLDGSAVRTPSSDFVLFHAGATAVLVNPSVRTASVSMTTMGSGSQQLFEIPPGNRLAIPLPGTVRIQSSEALAAVEMSSVEREFEMNAAIPVTDGQSVLVFPHTAVGGGFTSTLVLVSLSPIPQDVTMKWGTATATVRMKGNSSVRVSLTDLFQLPAAALRSEALQVQAGPGLFGATVHSLFGVLDIEGPTGLVTMESQSPETDVLLPEVFQGDGFFTGLALATGAFPAFVTIEVYEPLGGVPKTKTISMGANQQMGKVVSELVPEVANQIGGYIRIHSDQPIWCWEIYGSDRMLASGPPL